MDNSFLDAKGEIKVISDEAETAEAILDFISHAKNGWCDCGDKLMPSIAVNLVSINQAIRNAAKRHLSLKYITEITAENIDYCKRLAQLVELRHLDGVKLNFAVSNTHYMAATTLYEGRPVPQIVYSNMKELVAQQQYAFDALWEMSIPVSQRINEIETGLQPERMQLLADPQETKKVYRRIMSDCKKSVLLALPTKNAFARSKVMGISQLLVELAHQDKISIRLLVHHEVDMNSKDVCVLRNAGIYVNQLSANVFPNDDPAKEFRITLVVVDEEISLTIHTRHDDKLEFSEAIDIRCFQRREESPYLTQRCSWPYGMKQKYQTEYPEARKGDFTQKPNELLQSKATLFQCLMPLGQRGEGSNV